jgi:hypothetical protein
MKRLIIKNKMFILLFFLVVFWTFVFMGNDAISVDAWAWCDPPCGGCGMVGATMAGCTANQCNFCECYGYYGPDYVWYREKCPNVNPE